MGKRGEMYQPFEKRWSQKMILFMKHLCVFLLVFNLGLNATVHSQNQRVSVDLKNASIEDLIVAIKSQCNMGFLYDYNKTKSVNNITVKMQHALLSEVLANALKGTGFMAEMENNMIIIREAPNDEKREARVIQGKVIDDKKEPLPGVTVLIKGTTVGVVTNVEGMYKITLPDQKESTLVFSFIGMENMEIKITPDRNEYNVTMKEAQTVLDDVVVTGFFSKNKKSFTGSVKTISGDEIKAVSNTNLISALAMLTPGLKIMENNHAGSNPNNLPEIVIRGTSSMATDADIRPNQPILILDGVEITLRDLYDLDINEIERVDILKDASASALYGERAANGVIVIERKKVLNDKLRLTYNLDGSVDFPDLTTYNYLNAADKLEFEKRANLYDFENKYDMEEYNRKKLLISRGMDTDWMSKPLRTGYSLGNSVGVSGKGNDMTYRLNTNIRNVKGVMKGDYRNTYSISVFLSYHVANKVTVSYQSSYSGVKSKDSPYGDFNNYVILNPYDGPYDETGAFAKRLAWRAENPLYESTCGNYNKTSSHTFSNRINIRWDIMKGLYLTVNGAIVSGSNNRESFTSPTSAAFMEEEDLKKKGRFVGNDTKSLDLSGNFVISYNQPLGDNSLLTVNLGGDIYKNDSKSKGFTATGFLKPELHSPQYATTYLEGSSPIGSQDLETRAGFFANLNFILQDKYFIDGTVRRSGSSQFGANNRYAPFWSVGAGWNIHHETFLRKDWLNTFRLRYSYGVTGNISFSPYQAITTYLYSPNNFYLHGMGAVPKQMGNNDLKWQSTKTHNVGINADFLDNRFSITLDYYVKTTDDLLIDQTIPPSIGETTVKNNIGKQRNTGYEFDLSAVLLRNDNWQLYLRVNGAYNQNKILAISNALAKANAKANESDGGEPRVLYKEGESMTAIYAVRSGGINPANGKEVFINKNGEYTLTYNTDDKVVLGDKSPKLEGSLFPMLSFRNWSLNISMAYKFGGQIYNQTRAANVENVNPRYNVDQRAFAERWKRVNDLSPYLDIADTKDKKNYHSGRFVENENTVEISRVEVAYEFQPEWIKRIGLRRLRLAAGMNDVARLSTVKYERGTSYPFSRGFSFTISPTF